ncbi:hypothetical protein ACWEHT_20475 [Streptomyces sp. NPDC004646]
MKRAQQRERRRALVEHCGFRDTATPAMQHPPFCPGGVRALRKPHDPAGAFYQKAFDVVREQAAARRCQVMFTGNGGDEINAHHSRTHAELPTPQPVPWLGETAIRALAEVNEHLAPIPVLPVPTLMAFGMHNPGFLRAGIWPVSPLAHPRIVRFMEQLPHGTQARQGAVPRPDQTGRATRAGGRADRTGELPGRPGEGLTFLRLAGLGRHAEGVHPGGFRLR